MQECLLKKQKITAFQLKALDWTRTNVRIATM